MWLLLLFNAFVCCASNETFDDIVELIDDAKVYDRVSSQPQKVAFYQPGEIAPITQNLASIRLLKVQTNHILNNMERSLFDVAYVNDNTEYDENDDGVGYENDVAAIEDDQEDDDAAYDESGADDEDAVDNDNENDDDIENDDKDMLLSNGNSKQGGNKNSGMKKLGGKKNNGTKKMNGKKKEDGKKKTGMKKMNESKKNNGKKNNGLKKMNGKKKDSGTKKMDGNKKNDGKKNNGMKKMVGNKKNDGKKNNGMKKMGGNKKNDGKKNNGMKKMGENKKNDGKKNNGMKKMGENKKNDGKKNNGMKKMGGNKKNDGKKNNGMKKMGGNKKNDGKKNNGMKKMGENKKNDGMKKMGGNKKNDGKKKNGMKKMGGNKKNNGKKNNGMKKMNGKKKDGNKKTNGKKKNGVKKLVKKVIPGKKQSKVKKSWGKKQVVWPGDNTPQWPNGGKCRKELIEKTAIIRLFIVIDFCLAPSDCEAVYSWSLSLENYVRTYYGAACEITFVTDPDCHHVFVTTLPNADVRLLLPRTFFDNQFSTDSSSINLAVNILERGQQGDSTWIKQTKHLEAINSIRCIFTFFVCPDDNCDVGDTSEAQAVVRAVDIVHYSQLEIIQRYVCDEVPGSVPIEFYHESNFYCACRCPAGYELTKKNGQLQCSQIRDNCDCRWISKCYSYYINSDWRDQVCEIKDWAKKGILPVPMPQDNYVGHKVNENEDSDRKFSVGVPYVQLLVNGNSYEYAWDYFQSNNHLIFNELTLYGAGVYDIVVNAFDYTSMAGEPSSSCDTKLAIIDCHPPYSTCDSCPEGKETGVSGPTGMEDCKQDEFTLATQEAANSHISDYISWANGRSNDLCGYNPDENCDSDVIAFHKKSFGPVTARNPEALTLAADAKSCYDLTQTDITYLQTTIQNCDANTIQQNADFYKCTKCCKLDYTFTETMFNYENCDANGEEKCVPGDSCAYRQCLTAQPQAFFDATATIATHYQDLTKSVIGNLAELGYNAYSEIHLPLPAGCTDIASCTTSKTLEELFVLTPLYQANIEDQLFNFLDVNTLVRWRYRFNQGTWNWVSSSSSVDLNLSIRTITFEAWSACGRICEFVFVLYVHAPSVINVCDNFELYSFYQSSNFISPLSINADSSTNFCNFPQSDFAELTFEYNPISLIEKRESENDIKFHFESISCTASLDDRSSVPVATSTNRDRFLQRYAIIYPELATTQAVTKLYWECTIHYRDFLNQLQPPQVCSHTMFFHDCEPPHADCVWADCQKQCPAEQQRPYQVCGGLSISRDEADTSLDPSGKDVSRCCTSCGHSTTCDSIFQGCEDNTIFRCTPHGNPAEPVPVGLMTDAASLYPLSVAVVLGLFIVYLAANRIYRRRSMHADNETYHALL